MARIKLAYIGGGSTRAPGTMASFIDQGQNFDGSHVVLVDLDQDRLEVVKSIAVKLARHAGLDLTVECTPDRKAALQDCDAVLTSFRPGGFEARYLDESIPRKHGVIGQETQGPGGFFMALRSICTMQEIVRDMESACPRALLVNYTNPVNIVSQAVTQHSDIQMVSLCEGPICFPQFVARAAGLDPAKVDAVMIGINHACWSVHHLYDGRDMIPLVEEALERKRTDPTSSAYSLRLLELTAAMGSLPAEYFQYYYFTDELLDEQRTKTTTRSQDIMARVPDYWAHYREQAARDVPRLDPARSRGGIHELELAIDILDAVFNDRDEVWPVNVPNHGTIPNLPDDAVVEVPARVSGGGIVPLSHGPLPSQTVGLVSMLTEYQMLAAEAAWSGSRADAIRALMSNPLVLSPRKATGLYDEMSQALRDYLPARLVA